LRRSLQEQGKQVVAIWIDAAGDGARTHSAAGLRDLLIARNSLECTAEYSITQAGVPTTGRLFCYLLAQPRACRRANGYQL
jgi:hypothetical protein